MSRHKDSGRYVHELRKSAAHICPVCQASPGSPCLAAFNLSAEPLPTQDRDSDLPAYLEFQAMAAIAQLRGVDPDHWLVRAAANALPVMRDTRTGDLFTSTQRPARDERGRWQKVSPIRKETD